VRSVLFVDDEPLVLEGLRRMLRSVRNEWRMAFVQGAQAALEELGRQSYQVVVTDMRMPELDGAALLERIRERHPGIARIVLTGQTDREGAIRSVGCAHRFLMKPAEADAIKQTIERACQLRELMRNDSVVRVATALGKLPSLPEIFLELQEELDGDSPSPKRIAAIVGKDIAMTAKILQLVNSAFFGIPRRASTIEQAVTLLGTETIKALVLSNAAFTAFARRADPSLAALWEHSVEVGALARAITREEKSDGMAGEEALQAGILHDLGKLVLATSLPEEHAAAHTLAVEQRLSLDRAETEVLGCNHAQIGAYVLGLWGLPDGIVEAVAYHHDPAVASVGAFCSIVAVTAANAIAHERRGETPHARAPTELLLATGCAKRFEGWRTSVAASLQGKDAAA
jgi:putative nucleotidyltransferase with HDIG domain